MSSGRGSSLSLRPWQAEALLAWQDADRRGIVEAVTGTGKTRVGVAAVDECVREGARAVVLVPTVELQHQWAGQLRALLPSARTALLGGGHRPFGSWDVLVAVINTGSSPDSDALVQSCALVVADECHRYGAAAFARALRPLHRRRLGLTATLERQDDGIERYLIPYFGSVLMSYDYARAVPEGTVAPFRVALIGVPLTQGERSTYEEVTVRIERGVMLLKSHVDGTRPFFPQVVRLSRREDWLGLTARALVKAVGERRQVLTDCRAKHALVRELAPALDASRSLLFTERVAAAEEAAEALRGLGVPAGAVHAGMDQDERQGLLRDFSTGRVRVLCAPRVLDEGVDVPEADLAVVLSGTRTRRQMIQRMGRVLRLKADARQARFVLAYASGTVEDPASRAHEGFLDAIADVACGVQRFRAPEGLAGALQYLGGPPSLPRREVLQQQPTAMPVTTIQRRADLRQSLAAAQRERGRDLSARVMSPAGLIEDMAELEGAG